MCPLVYASDENSDCPCDVLTLIYSVVCHRVTSISSANQNKLLWPRKLKRCGKKDSARGARRKIENSDGLVGVKVNVFVLV